MSGRSCGNLTPRWSGRVEDKVPSSDVGARAAQPLGGNPMPRKPHPSNVPGDYYVEDGCCTMCMLPFNEAPELIGEAKDPRGYSHCFVKRQPQNDHERAQMVSAIQVAELRC